MKKITCMMVAILLLIAVMGTVAAEGEEYTYLAILTRFDPQQDVYDFTEDVIDISQYDISRAVHAVLCFSRPTPLILPDGSGWEKDDLYVGARLSFDKPFDVVWDVFGFEVIQIPDGVILEPKRVEIVGEIKYGNIVEIGDDYVILEAFAEYWERGLSGNNRFSITPDTLIKYEVPFFVGSGCQLIVDSAGVVLAMQQSNG